MSDQQRRGKYTAEFKQEGVRQVQTGQSIASVAIALGIPKASLSNWVRLHARGELVNTGSSPKDTLPVTPEQMELTRLRAENARLRMESDIAKKAAAYFALDTLQGTPGFKK
ncbi:transposase [Pusillimonas sp. ANT_WB101]|nr:transposase [Pusillimonas sp. ANT_WB101]